MALTVLLEACSTTPRTTDGGTDAGSTVVEPRFLDLRFRGVGETFSYVPFVGFGGGTSPGYPSGLATATATGPGFGEGLFASDFFEWFAVTYRDAGTYVTEVQWSGGACDSILSDALNGGATVLGLGGDPTRSDTTCTVLSVKPADGGADSAYMTGLSLGSSSIDFLNQQDFTRQYVVTALSEVDAGLYAFVAQAHLTRNEQFENRWVLTPSEEVPAAADALSDAGMVITAAAAGPSGIALVGTRPTDGGFRRVAVTLQEETVDPGPSFFALIDGGFAPVALLLQDLPDGGFRTVGIGQK